jgi:hypothetical protein
VRRPGTSSGWFARGPAPNRGWRSARTCALLLSLSLAVCDPRALGGAPPGGCGPDLGNRAICPKPYPAPALPAAGRSFTDPTFGTKIIRITDPSNAPKGAELNSAAVDSMFNADGSMFYVRLNGVEWSLYSIDKGAGTVKRLGAMPGPISMDGAPWHPTNPSIIYGISVDTKNRKLYEITLPRGISTVLHNFDAEIPAGGYPSPRVQISPDARYFAVTASSFAGQDNYDYVAVWDRQTDTSRVLNVPARFGAGTYLHSMEMDNTGQYIRLGGTTNTFGSVFWHWPDNVFSTSVILAAPDYFGGHKIQGAGVNLNLGQYGDAWLVRDLATPHVFTTLVTYPRKSGMVNWFEDTHASRVLAGGSFFESRYIETAPRGKFVRAGPGAVFQLDGYRRANGPNVGAPEVIRYAGREVPRVADVPSAPGQWSYASATDTLSLWLPDGSAPESGRGSLYIADWRPMMEEIVQVLKSETGTWTWRRLAHHRSHYTGWETGPRGNADPTGRFVLFQSNWDGSLKNADGSRRVDVFMLMQAPLPPSAPGR